MTKNLHALTLLPVFPEYSILYHLYPSVPVISPVTLTLVPFMRTRTTENEVQASDLTFTPEAGSTTPVLVISGSGSVPPEDPPPEEPGTVPDTESRSDLM